MNCRMTGSKMKSTKLPVTKGGPSQTIDIFFLMSHGAERYLLAISLGNKSICGERKTTSFLKVCGGRFQNLEIKMLLRYRIVSIFGRVLYSFFFCCVEELDLHIFVVLIYVRKRWRQYKLSENSPLREFARMVPIVGTARILLKAAKPHSASISLPRVFTWEILESDQIGSFRSRRKNFVRLFVEVLTHI